MRLTVPSKPGRSCPSAGPRSPTYSTSARFARFARRFRIARRLKLSKQKTPEKVEQNLIKLVPEDRWISFGHQVIWFGRKMAADIFDGIVYGLITGLIFAALWPK